MTVEELLAKIKDKDDKVRSATWLAAGEVAPGSQAAGRGDRHGYQTRCAANRRCFAGKDSGRVVRPSGSSVVGAIFSLLALVGSALQTVSSGTGFPSQFGVLFGVGAIISYFPILYGALGFIFGLILGGLYNLLAGVVGGVEIGLAQTQSQ